MPAFIPVEELFSGRHFDREIIVLCVRWYLSFKLSYRDLVMMMGERGIGLAHTTILRWVQHYTPEFEKRWQRYARPVGGSWRCDETYLKVKGNWMYLYPAKAFPNATQNGDTVVGIEAKARAAVEMALPGADVLFDRSGRAVDHQMFAIPGMVLSSGHVCPCWRYHARNV
jgi:hypothetical protein